jgi:predicted amidohydrolase
VGRNLESIVELARTAAAAGARLALFPECSLQGYVFETRSAALAVAERLDGEACSRLVAVADELGMTLVCGFVEQLGPARCGNSLLVARPGRPPSVYRKAHLPMLGVDRWAEPGESCAQWFEFEHVKFGLQVCYDLRFPEPSRMLGLAGVDVILLATNWPKGYEATADHAARTRAWENRCWLVAANRIGRERDTTFIGRSLAVEPWGHIVAQADHDKPDLLLIDVDPAISRSKLLPGHDGRSYDFFGSRRPDLYAPAIAEIDPSVGR